MQIPPWLGPERLIVLAVGRTQLLFTGRLPQFEQPVIRGDPRRRAFPEIREGETDPARQLNVVVNWFAELKRRVPVWAK
jgi:hypothetical protein